MARSEAGRQRRRQAERERYAQAKAQDPAIARRRAIKQRYGLTLEEYEARLAAQDGRCYVCGRTDTIMHLDHNHLSQLLRKFLCGPCDRALGFAYDSPEILRALADYLEEDHDNA